jgi:hypothetical protein
MYCTNPPKISLVNSRIHNNESESFPVVVVFLAGNVAVVTEMIPRYAMLPDQRYLMEPGDPVQQRETTLSSKPAIALP